MTRTEITAMQARIGTPPDGFWGPKSIAACQRWLRALLPSPHPWPKADQRSLTRFYGKPGDESQLSTITPPPVPLFYNGKAIQSLRCHWQIAERLIVALCDAYAAAPEIVNIYDGCYNFRPMRGSSTPSLHARGAAIDLSAAENGNQTAWPVAANMPLAVMETFARQGFLAAGAFWGRDAMHFQATQ